jgi:hypothetical protein
MICGVVRVCLDNANQPPNCPINRPLGIPNKHSENIYCFIHSSRSEIYGPSHFHLHIYFLVFGVRAFRLNPNTRGATMVRKAWWVGGRSE